MTYRQSSAVGRQPNKVYYNHHNHSMNHIYLLFIATFLSINFSIAQTVGIFQNDSLSFNGYTLFAPTSNEQTYLIDNCGNLVNSWISDHRPGMSAYLLETGELLRTARIPSNFNGGGTGGRIELYSWEGAMHWSYNYSTDTVHQHHDLEQLPNGNLLLIAWEWHSPEEAQNMGRHPDAINNQGIWSEQVVEIEPIGSNDIRIVWEWHLWDHLVQDFDSTKANFAVISEHPELLDINFLGFGSPQTDWVHFNSIDYHPELDQILLSSRHLSEFYIIDHSTTSEEAASHEGGNSGKGGDFLYRWGNPLVYQRGTLEEQRAFGQHDVTWIPSGLPNEGKILFFNNGIGRPEGSYSSVDMISPPIDENGQYILENRQAFGPEELTWTYTAPEPSSFYSNRVSGVQELPNGNILICSGRRGIFFEVTSEGQKVWEYINPVIGTGPVAQGSPISGNEVFKIRRYAPNYPAFDNKNLIATEPLELNPTNAGCQIFEDMVSITSEVAILENIDVLSNPIRDYLIIKNSTQLAVWIEIFNLAGQNILTDFRGGKLLSYPTIDWPRGIYIVRIFNVKKSHFLVKKIVK